MSQSIFEEAKIGIAAASRAGARRETVEHHALSNRQFDRIRQLALRLAGIELVERHRDLLWRRGQRLGIRESAGLDRLLDEVDAGAAAAMQKLVCLVTTKFTGFFRHPAQFALAAEHALRAARDRGRARLWSAAAATGEEPYSLAMKLIETFGSDEPSVDILATDVDAAALKVAERGEYAPAALQTLDAGRRERFFSNVDGRWSVVPAARRLVTFRALNLARSAWHVDGVFDVILCRNAVMYLHDDHRLAVWERMASRLAPDGLLLIDPTEHLGKAQPLFAPVADGVYTLRRSRGRAAGRSVPMQIL